jgi:hypothetical protein
MIIFIYLMVSSSCSIVLARKSYLNYRLYQAVSNKQTNCTEKVYGVMSDPRY